MEARLQPHPARCEKARSLVSLRIDDELSELEQTLLEAHVAACPACFAFSVEASAITSELRRTPLDRLERPLALPLRPRRAYLRTLQTTAAAGIAAAAVAVALVGVTSVNSGESQFAESMLSEPVSPERELQLLEDAVPAEPTGGTAQIPV